jgi:hypothetical protein
MEAQEYNSMDRSPPAISLVHNRCPSVRETDTNLRVQITFTGSKLPFSTYPFGQFM